MPSLPSNPARRVWLLVAAGTVVIVLVAAAFSLDAKLDRRRAMDRILAMRDSLGQLRLRVDSCQTSLAREETDFRRFDAEVDSLRREVRDFEAEDAAGVPEEMYDEYLAAFDRYNEAVPVWEALADTLRSHETDCRSLVERHNLLADTLRRRVEAWEAETGN